MDKASDSDLTDNHNDENKGALCARKVTEMRRFWQQESDALANDDTATARRAKANGDRLFNEVTDLIQGPLRRLANAYLHEDSLIMDGVRELIVKLYETWRDLSGSAGWEQAPMFWTCLKRLASNLFLRQVQRGYGKETVRDVDNPAAPARLREQNLSALQSTGGDPEEENYAVDIADEAAENPFDGLLQSDALGSLLSAIKNPLHRRALLLSIKGYKQPDIAKILGVKTEKTVYNYIQRAKEEALEWAKECYAADGEYADWFGGSTGLSPIKVSHLSGTNRSLNTPPPTDGIVP